MYIELLEELHGKKRNIWKDFMTRAGLHTEETFTQTVLIWDEDKLIATGSRDQNIFKCIAVDPAYQGEDLTSTVLTALRQEAFREGHQHLFLYTKPIHKYLFSSLFFYPVVQTDQVLLMENRRNGIREFLASLTRHSSTMNPLPENSANSEDTARIGAIVMNCNPFTKGHRYLIETASRECDWLYVFVLSEDKSFFSAEDRMHMVQLGTKDLGNVSVLPTGPYLVSSVTFPSYFLKDRTQAEQVHCHLDIQIFLQYFAPHFHINCRYLGTEPLSPLTAQYNEALQKHLPPQGIQVSILPRFSMDGIPVSASAARRHLEERNLCAFQELVPPSTYQYLQDAGLL